MFIKTMFNIKGGRLIFFLLCFINLIHCQPKKRVSKEEKVSISFEKANAFSAPIASGQSVNRTYYYHVQGDSVISYLDRNNKMIWFFNVYKEKIVDSINVNLFGSQHYLTNYKVLQGDSLILSFMPTYFGYNHDSVLILSNRNKKRLGTFNFEGARVPMKNGNPKISTNKEDLAFQIHDNKFPIIYSPKKNAVLTSIIQFGHFNTKRKNASIGWAYLDSTKKFKKTDIQFNPEFEGFFPTSYRYPRADIDKHGNLIAGVGYTSKLKKLNFSANKKRSKYIEFSYVDSIPYFSSKEKADRHEDQIGKYKYIRYDKYIDKFWFQAKIAPDSNSNPFLLNFPFQSVVLFNSDLQKLGEGLLPPYHTSPVIPFKKGLLVKNNYASSKEDALVFTYLKYSLDTISKKKFNRKLKKRKSQSRPKETLYKKYLKNITGSGIFTNYVLLPLDRTCTACKSDFLKFLMKNAKDSLTMDKNLAVIVMGSNQKVIKQTLQKYDLQPYLEKFIFTDSKARYKKAMLNWNNLKLIKFKEGKIIKNKIFNPGQLKDLKIILTGKSNFNNMDTYGY